MRFCLLFNFSFYFTMFTFYLYIFFFFLSCRCFYSLYFFFDFFNVFKKIQKFKNFFWFILNILKFICVIFLSKSLFDYRLFHDLDYLFFFFDYNIVYIFDDVSILSYLKRLILKDFGSYDYILISLYSKYITTKLSFVLDDSFLHLYYKVGKCPNCAYIPYYVIFYNYAKSFYGIDTFLSMYYLHFSISASDTLINHFSELYRVNGFFLLSLHLIDFCFWYYAIFFSILPERVVYIFFSRIFILSVFFCIFYYFNGLGFGILFLQISFVLWSLIITICWAYLFDKYWYIITEVYPKVYPKTTIFFLFVLLCFVCVWGWWLLDFPDPFR